MLDNKRANMRVAERNGAARRVSASEREKDRANESDSLSVNSSVTFIPVDVGNDRAVWGESGMEGWK